MSQAALFVGGGIAALWAARWAKNRLLLSRAKHPSLRGHARMARRVAKWIPFYEYGEAEFFGSDEAPSDVQELRRRGFERLSEHFRRKAPRTLAVSAGLEEGLSDVDFVNHYRVPFQFRERVRAAFPLGLVVQATRGRHIQDLDGNWSLDVTGAYGVNVFGYDFYKGCIDRGAVRARSLGPVLGPYHPAIADNVARLQRISKKEQVSFHMSGTEAVMQAVRLARYHTGKSHIVRFCGAYHGWWDGVQAGVGNPRPAREVYTLADMSEKSLEVLRTRNDIACVLVNPLQGMHPNGNAPTDSMLVDSKRSVRFDKAAYSEWLKRLRAVCSARGIVLIFDEVFLGFRLAVGGAQEYFGVDADLVTYGKTLGGGLPIGVVCGRAALMKRYREDKPTDICFARGTFNSHPYVMTAMNEFLQHLDWPEVQASYADIDAVWDRRAAELNTALESRGLPMRVANMVSVWATLFTQTSRYSWMFQYYLRAAGITMSWVGSGRFLFSHDLTEQEFGEFRDRFVGAAEAMVADGWWWQGAHLTDKWIRRRVLGETLRALFGRKRSNAVPAVAQPAIQPVAGSAVTSVEIPRPQRTGEHAAAR